MPSAYNIRTQHDPTMVQILRLFAQHAGATTIERTLGLPHSTVYDRLQDLQAQLALPDRAALRAYAASLTQDQGQEG